MVQQKLDTLLIQPHPLFRQVTLVGVQQRQFIAQRLFGALARVGRGPQQSGQAHEQCVRLVGVGVDQR